MSTEVTTATDMRGIVSRQGRVTIPKALRDRLGIQAGDVLAFEAHEGRLIATKAVGPDQITALYGTLQLRERTDDLIRRMRDPGPDGQPS